MKVKYVGMLVIIKHGATHLNLVELSRVLDDRYRGVVKHHTNDLIRYHCEGLSFYFRLKSVDKGWKVLHPLFNHNEVVNYSGDETVEYSPKQENINKIGMYFYDKNDGKIQRESLFEKSLYPDYNETKWVCFPSGKVYIEGGEALFLAGSDYPIEEYKNEKNNRAVSPDLVNRAFEVEAENVYVLIKEYEEYFHQLDNNTFTDIVKRQDNLELDKSDRIKEEIEWCNGKFMELYPKSYPVIPFGGFTIVSSRP